MGSKRKLVNGSDDGSGEEESQSGDPNPEMSIKGLYQKEGARQLGDPQMSMAKKVELISKLEVARQEEADQKQLARRKAWKEEVQKKIFRGNAEFKEVMEGASLEEVEVGEKAWMSRISLEWREAFKNDRVSFLLLEALKAKQSSELRTKPWWPRAPSKVALESILKLRLVSKSVKQLIDDFHSSDAVTATYLSGFLLAERIHGLKGTRNLTNKLGENVNPFVFRRVYISPETKKCRDEFWKEMKVILARWGKEIWSASITFNGMPEESEISNDYDLLVAYLKLMPNLRCLFISNGFEDMDSNKLTDRIASNPLPELPYLHFASFYSGVEAQIGGPSIIRDAFLSRYNRKLKYIKLDSNIALPLEGHFPSLRKLELRFPGFPFANGMDELVNMNIFKGLNNWGYRLKKLSLQVGGDLFRRHISRSKRSYVLKGLFLELPHLERLHIGFRDVPLETLDILLPCKSLKSITYSATQHRDDLDPWAPVDNEGIFKFPNQSNLYESNIWKLLPELKLIRIGIKTFALIGEPDSVPWNKIKCEKYTYTRDGYHQHCKLQLVQIEARVEPKEMDTNSIA